MSEIITDTTDMRRLAGLEPLSESVEPTGEEYDFADSLTEAWKTFVPGKRSAEGIIRSLAVTVDEMETDPGYVKNDHLVDIEPYLYNIKGHMSEFGKLDAPGAKDAVAKLGKLHQTAGGKVKKDAQMVRKADYKKFLDAMKAILKSVQKLENVEFNESVVTHADTLRGMLNYRAMKGVGKGEKKKSILAWLMKNGAEDKEHAEAIVRRAAMHMKKSKQYEDLGLEEGKKKRYVKYEIEKSTLPGRGPWMAKVYKADGSWETTFAKTKAAVQKDVDALMSFNEDVELSEGIPFKERLPIMKKVDKVTKALMKQFKGTSITNFAVKDGDEWWVMVSDAEGGPSPKVNKHKFKSELEKAFLPGTRWDYDPREKSMGNSFVFKSRDWLGEKKSPIGEDAELSEGMGLDNKVYTKKEKVRKYNVPASPLSSFLDPSAAGKMLRSRLPDWDQSKHSAAASKWEAKAKKLEKDYNKTLEAAAQETWGRSWQFGDYKVSGIGSSEFSEKKKDKLRSLNSQMNDAKQAAIAHKAAAKGKFKGEDVELTEGVSEVQLNFADQIANFEKARSGDGIKLNTKVYNWFVKEFSRQKDYTVTKKAKAIRDQHVTLNRRTNGKDIQVDGEPFGNYFKTHTNVGGSNPLKQYFDMGKLAEDVELEEATHKYHVTGTVVYKRGKWTGTEQMPFQDVSASSPSEARKKARKVYQQWIAKHSKIPKEQQKDTQLNMSVVQLEDVEIGEAVSSAPKPKKVKFTYRSSYMGNDISKDVSGYAVGHVAFTKGFGRGNAWSFYHLDADEPFAGMSVLPKSHKQATLIADALYRIVPKTAKGKEIGRVIIGKPYIDYRDYVLKDGGEESYSSWKLKEDADSLEEAKKTYVVNVKKYFRGITDRGAVVKANSEEEAIAKAAKQMKKKPNYLEIEGVYEDVDLDEATTKHGYKIIEVVRPDLTLVTTLTNLAMMDKKSGRKISEPISGGKPEAAKFYAWAEKNEAKLKKMSFDDVLKVLKKEGIKYHTYPVRNEGVEGGLAALIQEKKGVVWYRKQAETMHKKGMSDKEILAALVKLGATKEQADFYLGRAKLQRESDEGSMKNLIERRQSLVEGGSGLGSRKKGKKASPADFGKVKAGDLLAQINKQFNATNVLRVTKKQSGPSKGFNAIFVNPDNPKEKRMASDKEFFVWADDLGNGEYYFLK